jgi:hypothetical protein
VDCVVVEARHGLNRQAPAKSLVHRPRVVHIWIFAHPTPPLTSIRWPRDAPQDRVRVPAKSVPAGQTAMPSKRRSRCHGPCAWRPGRWWCDGQPQGGDREVTQTGHPRGPSPARTRLPALPELTSRPQRGRSRFTSVSAECRRPWPGRLNWRAGHSRPSPTRRSRSTTTHQPRPPTLRVSARPTTLPEPCGIGGWFWWQGRARPRLIMWLSKSLITLSTAAGPDACSASSPDQQEPALPGTLPWRGQVSKPLTVVSCPLRTLPGSSPRTSRSMVA